MKIRYLKHHAIDKEKWDANILTSPNGLVYGLSGYLDIAAPGWDALISPDYEYILPLPRKTKYGLPYVPKVIYIQKFSIFSKHPVNAEIVAAFLKAVPRKFLKVNLNLTFDFIPPEKRFRYNFLNTQELNLNNSYNNLYNNFSKSLRKNIRKALKKGVEIKVHAQTEDVAEMQAKVFKRKNIYTENNAIKRLSSLLRFSQNNNPPKVYSAYCEGRLCAAAYFMKFGNRFTIFSGTTEQGRKTQAGFLIINEFIKSHAATDSLLDFGGSNIEGVAQRNLGFGAKNLKYISAKRDFKLFKFL
jgi:hypothetical protein